MTDRRVRAALLDYLWSGRRLHVLREDQPLWTRHDGAGEPGLARETDIVSITWWTWENVLEQALFIGPPGEPARLKDVTGQGLLACVWELQIHHFESLAWLRTVLSNPQGPDLDAYLSQRFRAVV